MVDPLLESNPLDSVNPLDFVKMYQKQKTLGVRDLSHNSKNSIKSQREEQKNFRNNSRLRDHSGGGSALRSSIL